MKGMIERILEQGNIQILFQPLLDAEHQRALGYEALSRGPSDSPLHSPIELFHQAKMAQRLADMELLCLRLAIQGFAAQKLTGKLFINLSPSVLLERGVAPIRDTCRQHELPPHNVVIELTEHHPVACWQDMTHQVNQLRQAGFLVAIDDLGAGNSGLRLWSELRPDFVKLDHYFAANLDSDTTKRQFVASMLDLAGNLGCKLILEGVEQLEEYEALRRLGIRYCQGYLLGKPAPLPVLQLAASQPLPERELGLPQQVSGLAQPSPTLSPDNYCEQALALFKKHPETGCLPILARDRKPIGILRRQSLLAHFAERFGHSLYAKAPVSRLMDTSPILVEASQSLVQVSQQLIEQSSDEMDAWFIICDNGHYLGMGRVRELMRKLTNYKIKLARYANPLTLLPGNVPIQRAIETALRQEQPFWLAYCDLNHFKPYNDVCGYDRGDQMIKLVARLLRRHFTRPGNFIGHLGGDDFILLLRTPDWQLRLDRLQDEFRQQRLSHYRAEDVVRAGIVGRDREGIERHFPLIELAVGLVYWSPEQDVTASQLSEWLALAKKQAKHSENHFYIQVLPSEQLQTSR